MTRVSENSNKHAIHFAISRAKKKLEDLQLKGTNLKSFVKPSQNPVGNINLLDIKSRIEDNKQYLKNSNFALMNLEVTENALDELTGILSKAKEMGIAQSSDVYNAEVRKSVAREVSQMKNQILAIANRRLGNRYIFSGFATLTRPFQEDGNYLGDEGKISLEVSKDFFVPINLNGVDVFYSELKSSDREVNPLGPFPKLELASQSDQVDSEKESSLPLPQESQSKILGGRDIASVNPHEQKTHFDPQTNSTEFLKRESLFGVMNNLIVGLETNDSTLIQDTLEKFDNTINRLITLRTKIGARTNSVFNAELNVEASNLVNQTQKSKIGDADVAELFSDLNRQQDVLKATYKTGQGLLNRTLLDFLR